MKTRSKGKSKSPVYQLPTPIHIIESETQCLHCGAEFLDEDDLKLHIEQMHARGIVLCKFCGAKHSGLHEYVTHFICNHLEMLLVCYYCHRGFLKKAELKNHELKHCVIQNEPLTCSHCTQMFASRLELQNHEYKVHGSSKVGVLLHDIYPLLSSALNMQVTWFLDALAKSKPFSCVTCGNYSTSVIDYVSHLNTSNCKGYACDKCFKVYKRKKGILKHVLNPLCQNISKKITKQCNKCNKIIDVTEMLGHKEACKAENCKTCGAIFTNTYELAEHKVREHGVSKAVTVVTCKFCKREFVGEASLKKHIDRVHQDLHLYKYVCSYCDDCFRHPKKLFAHFYSKHKDIFPYTCQICERKFRVRKNFTIHIKLDHNSIGFVEFDKNLHVIFTDKKSENPIIPTIPDGFGCDTEQSNENSDASNHQKDQTEAVNVKEVTDNTEPTSIGTDTDNTENNTTTNPITASDNDNNPNTNSEDCNDVSIINESPELKTRNVKKRKKVVSQRPRKARKMDIDSDLSEDEPLIKIRRRVNSRNVTTMLSQKRGRRNAKNQTAKLTCKICNKYCYTFQNYHHHMSLHEKSTMKRCIKCLQYFKSRSELNNHINKVHSTSKLTETLKSLLAKRNKNPAVKTNSNQRPADTIKSIQEQRKKAQLMNAHKTLTNKFLQTIKKVDVHDDTSVTITSLTEHSLSVKKYIENFRPDNADGVNISSSVTIKPLTKSTDKPLLIKLKKFREEPAKTNGLRLPVKFKDSPTDIQSNVTVKLVQELLTKPRTLNFIYDDRIPTIDHTDKEEINDYCNTFADETDYTQYKNEIPEVAHEVMLGEAEEVPRMRQLAQEIYIPNISEEHGGVRIGHLTPKAPFYKIVKVKTLLNQPEKEEIKKEEAKDMKAIELPDGTHLVTVKNPYSHLMPNDHLQKVVKAHTNKYYTPKVKNIQQAFIQALKNLNKPKKPRESKKKKKTKLDSEPIPSETVDIDTKQTEVMEATETTEINQLENSEIDEPIEIGRSLEIIETTEMN